MEEHPLPMVTGRESRIAPFPGHEHPRIGFLEGAIAPLRGTKVVAFLPWDPLLPGCKPGETVRVRGPLRFEQGG